jgi:hypothetical protein
MAPLVDDEDVPDVSYPRFAHGETLEVVICGEEFYEFRADGPEEFIRANVAVTVTDVA